jgi:nucleoside-triphosphatase THEP1
MIYLLTGPIRSGKTGTLQQWIQSRSDVDGLLCPDDDQGKRYFFEIKTSKRFKLEIDRDNNHDSIVIGPFTFLNSAFNRANTYLLKAAKDTNVNYFVIDEIGKLELKNSGLHTSAEYIIAAHKKGSNTDLILVVRDTLLQQVIAHYNIVNYQIITTKEMRTNFP